MIYAILEVYNVFQVIICDICNFSKCLFFSGYIMQFLLMLLYFLPSVLPLP